LRAIKYSNTHPNTDPSDAINAYNGMRAWCWIESSISSKSLITGNVSTDESRKEIKNNPGAPSVPANATIFAFHPLTLSSTPFLDSNYSKCSAAF
jgi:hypothetical protein